MARGWCPGVFAPMWAEDGLLVRVKPRLSRIDSGTARRIAEAAEEYGNGTVELTCRANLQLRGFTPASAEAFAGAMVACGAADADPARERRRNIVVSPLAGADPTIRGHPDIVGVALERALAEARDLMPPAKFGFAVDGGGALALGDTGADVVIETDHAACRVRIAGGHGEAACGEAEAAHMAVALARAFQRLGGTRRMRDLVDAVGEDAIIRAACLSAPWNPARPRAGAGSHGCKRARRLKPPPPFSPPRAGPRRRATACCA